jgi:hypothetical protein
MDYNRFYNSVNFLLLAYKPAYKEADKAFRKRKQKAQNTDEQAESKNKNFKTSKGEKMIQRLEQSYNDVKKFARLLRDYSVFATATAVGQLSMLTWKSFTGDNQNWIAFTIGAIVGLYVGIILERYYESSVKELESYAGKNYQQSTLKQHQNNTRWGFITALFFNLATFTAGTTAVIITAYQLTSVVDTANLEELNQLKRDIGRYEVQLDKLNEDMLNIDKLIESSTLAQKKAQEQLEQKINSIYADKIKEALKIQEDKLKMLEKWKKFEMSKKVNANDGYKTLNRKYEQRLKEIKTPLEELKKEYQAKLANSTVKISLTDERELLSKDIETKIERIEAKIDKKRTRLKQLANHIVENKYGGITFAKAFLVSIMLASLYYFFQNRNYKYQETLLRKIENERGINKANPFTNIDEVILKVNDDLEPKKQKKEEENIKEEEREDNFDDSLSDEELFEKMLSETRLWVEVYDRRPSRDELRKNVKFKNDKYTKFTRWMIDNDYLTEDNTFTNKFYRGDEDVV